MRILSLRFKNLNSLVGEWCIDFTHPAYSTNGIFAITGPTGAGKSTLLDAMSLALYGRTPRLARVNKNENEIMSQRTGECFAELSFETAQGQFRSHWSQHRARRQASGELQTPKHEISKTECGTIIADQLRTVSTEVERITGMDFDRFTRSMLLAQGSFAAFLQASSDERAPILEQITGTEIYSTLSRATHERYRTERQRLESLTAQLALVELLSPETEHALQQELTLQTEQHNQTETELQQHRVLLQQQIEIERLQTESVQLQQQKVQLHQAIEDFAPQAKQLQLADKANPLRADYAKLESIRSELQQDQAQYQQFQQELPQYRIDFLAHKENHQLIKEQRDQLQQQIDQAQPLWRQVRELDQQQQHQNRLITKQHEQLQRTEQLLSHHLAQQKTQAQQQQTVELQLQQTQDFLEQHQADAQLTQDIGLIQSRIEQIQGLTTQEHNQKEAINVAKLAAAQARENERKQQLLLIHLETQAATLSQEQNSLKTARQTLLIDKSASQWRALQLQLLKQNNTLQLALQCDQERRLTQKLYNELLATQQVQLDEQQKTNLQFTHYQAQQTALKQIQAVLQDNIVLQQQVDALTTERQRLISGEPCPLCGAVEHPYANGDLPTPTATEQELQQIQTQLSDIDTQLAQSHKNLITIDLVLKQNQSQQHLHLSHLETTTTQLRCYLTELPLPPDLELHQIQRHLTQLQTNNTEALQQSTAVLTELEELDSRYEDLQTQWQQQQQTTSNAKYDLQQISHQLQRAEERLTRQQQELIATQAQQINSLDQLGLLLQPYAISMNNTVITELLPRLQQRLQHWNTQKENETTLLQTRRDALLQAQHQQEIIQNTQQQVKTLQQERLKSQQEQRQFHQERTDLFGDEDVNQQETQWREQLQQYHQQLEQAQKHVELVQQQFLKHENQITQLAQRITQRTKQEAQTKTAFMQHLIAVGFETEAEYLAACLAEPLYQELYHQQQQLHTQDIELTTRLRSTDQQLQNILAAAPAESMTITQLQSQIEQRQQQQQEQQQALGRVQQQLDSNNLRKAQQITQRLALEKQKTEYSKWALLHELIGSADGKKFRNFAQGLTFEMMVAQANQQLQKMSDRYLLIRDLQHPLELNVIDNYQAGEIRSTKNLSGGESFIVSLALALGLSHMASQNVRIDSLFLDEGFGTLDETALDIALETLATLQQEGKIIGVISHVAALKERISTQIHVQPQFSGQSQITGPGCQAL